MLHLFNKNKPTLDALKVPDFGWPLAREEKNFKQWVNEELVIGLSINFFSKKPDLPTIQDVRELQDFYRNILVENNLNGGLILVDIVDLKGYKAVKTIFKIPQEPSGMNYIGSYTIPFANCSYVLKLQAPEVGMTGVRDAFIADRLLKEGKIDIGNNQEGYRGWARDPYDVFWNKGTLMNLSEDIKYDVEFPDHPLTKIRLWMKKLEDLVAFDTKLSKIKTFNL